MNITIGQAEVFLEASLWLPPIAAKPESAVASAQIFSVVPDFLIPKNSPIILAFL